MSTAKAVVLDLLDNAETARTGALTIAARYLQDRAGRLLKPISVPRNGEKPVVIIGIERESPGDSAYPIGLQEGYGKEGDGFLWALEDFDIVNLRAFIAQAEFQS